MTANDWMKFAAVAVPALVSIGAAWWSVRASRISQRAELDARRLLALEERTAARKYEMYEPFIQTIGDMLTPGRKAEAEKRLEGVLSDFQTAVAVWGSDETLEAFSRWRRASGSNPPPPEILVRLTADLMLAIRRDVAWPDTAATGIHAIGIRINDLDASPEMRDALTVPLKDLAKSHGWKPPFDI